MTDIELILNMPAAAATKKISQTANSATFDESKQLARQGGSAASVAKKYWKQKQVKKL